MIPSRFALHKYFMSPRFRTWDCDVNLHGGEFLSDGLRPHAVKNTSVWDYSQ
jgi:hypothetical protein